MSSIHMSADGSTPIAIVGLSFRGPGDATSAENLLRMVAESRESRSPIPSQKWNASGHYHPDPSRQGSHIVEYGHWFQQDVYEFDAPFFNLSAVESAALDPQQRMLLECTYEAFENSGMPLNKLVGTDTSVFTAVFCTDYTDMLWRDPEMVPMYQCTNSGATRANMANRVSYSFDLKGPSITVDTACSGGLTALHLACQSLVTGESTQAVVSGSSLILGPETMVTMSMMRFLSPDGRCYAFDDRANGYARGEGVTVLLLKRLDDALANGDTIRAVIRGTGRNPDGKTTGIAMPSGLAQEALIRSVYAKTGLDLLDTAYIECHGTGTQAGDTTEARAISNVFGPGRQVPLAIGSVKTNIGHLEAASGLAGVLKCILMLENEIILPNRNFKHANLNIPLEEWKLRVPTTVEPWNSMTTRRASVNSFGYGGTNVHAILESADNFLRARGLDQTKFTRRPMHRIMAIRNALELEPEQNGNPFSSSGAKYMGQRADPQVFAVSAFDPTAGEACAKNLAYYVEERQDMADATFLSSLAFTLSDRRTVHPWKATVTASSSAELISGLRKVRFSSVKSTHNLAFVFTGQGAHWCGMGKELIKVYPAFRKSLEKCGAMLKRFGAPFDVIDELEAGFETSQLDKALYSQSLCTALQIALIDMLSDWDIQPKSVTGHSSGEIGAAYAAGALKLEDAMLVAYARGLAMSDLSTKGPKGAMVAVGMDRQELNLILVGLKSGKAVIACSNSPKSFTVSGDKCALDELQGALRQRGVYNRRLNVEVAYHSHHMELVADSYRNTINNIKVLADSPVRFFSSVMGELTDKSKLGPDYWVSNLVGEVKFAESLHALVTHSNTDSTEQIQTIIEIGPHSALAGPIRETLEAAEFSHKTSIDYLSVLVRRKDAVVTALTLASKLFVAGFAVRLAAVNQNACSTVPPLNDLPSYAWNHSKSYSAESRISRSYRERPHTRMSLIGVLDVQSSALEPRWRQILRISELPWLRDHNIQSNVVYPAAGYLTMAIEAAAQRNAVRAPGTKIEGFQFREVNISSALIIPETPGEVEVFITLKAFSESLRSPSNLWDEFSVSSVSESNRWTEHCRGLIAVKTVSRSPNLVSGEAQEASDVEVYKGHVDDFEAACQSSWDAKEMYNGLWQTGMHFGPTFANISDLRIAPDKCIGRVQIPDTAAVMPMKYQEAFVVHPATLDSIIQTFLPALAAQTRKFNDAIVPVSIDDLFVSHEITRSPGHAFDCYTSTYRKDHRFTFVDITVFATPFVPGSKPVITVGSMTVATLQRQDPSENNDQVPSRAYNLEWAPDIEYLTPEQLVNVTSSSTGAEHQVTKQKLDRASVELIREALARTHEQQSVEVGGSAHVLRKLLDSRAEHATSDSSTDRDSSLTSASATIAQAAERLPNLLVGGAEQDDPAQLYDLMDVATTPGLFAKNHSIATYLQLLSHKKPDLTVLTIGPQSGPASLNLLLLLSDLGCDAGPFKAFHHSDAELNIDHAAKTRFPSWANSITFVDLKIKDSVALESSSNVEQTYDVVVAFNMAGSSIQLAATLSAASALQTYRGKVLLADHAVQSPLATLVWSSLPSFVSSQKEGAELDLSDAHDVAQEKGYQAHAMLADRVHVMQKAREEHEVETAIDTLIVATDQDLESVDIALLQRLCEEQGSAVQLVSLEAAHPEPKQACIVLNELSQPVLVEPTDGEWEALKRITHCGAGVLWVTRGAGSDTCADPQAALIQGLARTVRAEVGDRPMATLDLDEEVRLNAVEAAKCIAGVFRHVMRAASAELELRERNGVVHVPRLIEDLDASRQLQAEDGIAAATETLTLQQAGSCRLFAGTPGLLDSLHFAPDERVSVELAAGDIEVEVQAAGINFKDVMMAMGQIPIEDLGLECSGMVTSVGSQVQCFAVGDRVVTMGPGSFCTRLRVDARLAYRIPDSMSWETAAALPITHVTAYHAVRHLGRIVRGDTVLVHAAAGGLGQALVELSIMAGARVLVTVGSADKKHFVMERFGIPEHHVLYSRDTSFASHVMRLTQGVGVDVVMNSLAGEALRQSWTCIAANGRFVELGQRDITVNSRLDMAPFARNASFIAFNLAKMLRQDPQMACEMLGEVLKLYDRGTLRGYQSLETYTYSHLGDAFRKMQTGRHMGKLVAVARPADIVRFQGTPALSPPLFDPDAAYLLVGGLGGLGSATALWMAERGARHLVLLSRSGASPSQDSILARLRATNCATTVLACDVAERDLLASALATVKDTLPPIRGVIQGAMVLRDGMLAQLSRSDYLAVLRPKLHGTWNLHALLPDLDFFIVESSISGIVGNAAQAAYAAANTFLDAFARYRRSLGLPATAIDIGAVEGIGYLARNPELKRAMERQGFSFTDEARLMRLLDFSISHPARQPRRSHIITGLGAWHPDCSLPVLGAPLFSRHRLLSSRGISAPAAINSLRNTLKHATTHDAEIALLAALVDHVVARTDIPVENVDTSKGLQDYGIDSLAAVELRNWLSRETDSVIPILELLGAESLTDLAAKIVARSRPITVANGAA
uniref:Polyketide synthase n=1 Tax=Didymella maydis TaxID=259522 RepID=Q6RKG3_9PLEO|nr:polyketide synthase [Didymella maydis]